MGFKENLKDECKYQGILVKELADRSGVPKGTIDYLAAPPHRGERRQNCPRAWRFRGVSCYKKRPRPGHIPAHVPKIRRMNDSQLDFVGEVIRLIEKKRQMTCPYAYCAHKR